MVAVALAAAPVVIAGVFRGSITVGTAVIALMLLGFAGYFATKNKALESSQKQANDWRDHYLAERQLHHDAVKRAAEALGASEAKWSALVADAEARYAEQRELKHTALTENAALKMATDLTMVMRELAETRADLLRRMSDAEERIGKQLAVFSQTQQAQTEALQAIVKQLGVMH